MSKASRFLALDLGRHTGWAISDPVKILESGVRDFDVKYGQHPGLRGIKFYNFLLTLGDFDEIFLEKIAFGGKGHMNDGRELNHGLRMLVNMYSAGFNIPVTDVYPTTLKKQFTGYGAAKKHQMCEHAILLGWQGGKRGTDTNHDEVDACALLITQLREKYGYNISF